MIVRNKIKMRPVGLWGNGKMQKGIISELDLEMAAKVWPVER
jgi:hypothetical protein